VEFYERAVSTVISVEHNVYLEKLTRCRASAPGKLFIYVTPFDYSDATKSIVCQPQSFDWGF